jgi:hypothetical protein
MLDFDIAELYEVGTKVLNQAVKRNIKRFPEDFMFRLSTTEWKMLKSQIKTSNIEFPQRSQFVTFEEKGLYSKYMPFAFTEQGIAMLSGVLNSEKAIQMNIAIMRAFVEARRFSLLEMDLKAQFKEVKNALEVHDSQLNQIYDAIENLLDENAAQKKWETRERIGFKK